MSIKDKPHGHSQFMRRGKNDFIPTQWLKLSNTFNEVKVQYSLPKCGKKLLSKDMKTEIMYSTWVNDGDTEIYSMWAGNVLIPSFK